MSLTKTGVFLASRFKEFETLRTSLKGLIAGHRVVQFSPIDLNDGAVTHRPPLSECLAFVRRAEFMVLLLGDTYGALAPGSDKSFTHLEYLEAMRSGSKTRVLVFCIGASYRGGQIDYCRDNPVFAGWQRQLEASHTLGYLAPDLAEEDKARAIFDHLLAALYDMRFGQLNVDDEAGELDDAFDTIDDETLGDDEVNRLESINAQARGLALVEDRDNPAEPLQALMKPAGLASREQREEADRAIRLGEYGLAMQHLRQALKLRPMDLKSNYWLAQLLLSMGRKDKLAQVMELGERAARIAVDESLPIRGAAGYMLAARAARDLGLLEEASRLVSNALDLAPGYAKAHLEKARLSVAKGKHLAAIEGIRRAYQCFGPSLKEVYGDPVFRPIRYAVNSLVSDIKNKQRNDIQVLASQFRLIDGYLGRQFAMPDLESLSLSRLMDFSRTMLRKRYEDVCQLLDVAFSSLRDQGHYEVTTPTMAEQRFSFRDDADVLILTKWLLAPGDVIETGMTVLRYKFYNWRSDKEFIWSRKAVRLVEHCVAEGEQVSSDAPLLFRYMPVEETLPAPTLSAQLMNKKTQAESELEEVQQKLDHLRSDLASAANTRTKGKRLMGVGLVLIVPAVLFSIPISFLFGLGVVVLFVEGVRDIGDGGKQMVRLKEKIQTTRDEIAKLQADIISCSAELTTLENTANANVNAARITLQLFEAKALTSATKMLPFTLLHRARPGSLVKVSAQEFMDGKSATGQDLHFCEEFPDSIESYLVPGRFRLFRVQKIHNKAVFLSRSGAYRAAPLQEQ